jgi:hypothetical protein
MHTIQGSDTTLSGSVCFSHVSNVRWKHDLSNYNLTGTFALGNYVHTIRAAKSQCPVSSISKSQTSLNDSQIAGGKLHLFLIQNSCRGETSWKTGIASGLAHPGDLVCWIHGVERALVLRVTLQEFNVADFRHSPLH